MERKKNCDGSILHIFHIGCAGEFFRLNGGKNAGFSPLGA
jgi:hypothetical protein